MHFSVRFLNLSRFSLTASGFGEAGPDDVVVAVGDACDAATFCGSGSSSTLYTVSRISGRRRKQFERRVLLYFRFVSIASEIERTIVTSFDILLEPQRDLRLPPPLMILPLPPNTTAESESLSESKSLLLAPLCIGASMPTSMMPWSISRLESASMIFCCRYGLHKNSALPAQFD
uniref:Uncharacterized protein n=1 Tax=Anopheles atroparvus TaxID=41427 RepID=A0A182J1Q6_ANOAO